MHIELVVKIHNRAWISGTIIVAPVYIPRNRHGGCHVTVCVAADWQIQLTNLVFESYAAILVPHHSILLLDLLILSCRYLIKFLAKLTEYQDANKMTPSNIAIVLGPNLLWPLTEG